MSKDLRNQSHLRHLRPVFTISFAYFVTNRSAKSISSAISVPSVHTGSKKVSGRSGLKISLQYITVTRSSVSLRLIMLWV